MTQAVAVLMAFVTGASAAPVALPFQVCPVRVAVRDLVIHSDTATFLVAAYGRDAVWRMEPHSGERLAELPVGDGPCALALSPDESVLACVHHRDGTVAFIDTASMTVAATGPCGEAPTAIAPLPDGRFAVISKETGHLYVVDPQAPEDPAEFAHVARKPGHVAALAGTLAVSSNKDDTVRIFAMAHPEHMFEAPFGDDVTGLAALDAHHFVVATEDEVAVIRGETGVVTRRLALEAHDVAVRHERVFVLTDDDLLILDPTLEPLFKLPLARHGKRIAVDGGLVAAFAPKSMTWQYHRAVVQAEMIAETREDPPPEEAPAEITAEEIRAARAAQRLFPPAIGSLHAPPPRLMHKPSSSVMFQPRKATIADALTGEHGLDEGKGFHAPDWTQPMRDLVFKEGAGPLDGGAIEVGGDVRLRLGNTYFGADHFRFDENAGAMRAWGNVAVLQDEAVVAAEQVDYAIPPQDAQPPSTLVEGALSEQELARARLSTGKVTFTDVQLFEPTRELLADHAEYDFATEQGYAENVSGRIGIYHFSAEKAYILGPTSLDAQDAWVTTCDRDPPHYRFRVKKLEIRDGQIENATNVRLVFGRHIYAAWWPRFRRRDQQEDFDFDSGHRAKIGYYVNVGQRFAVNPDMLLGPRIYATTKEGVGVGLDAEYDFTETPTALFFGGRGTLESLYTNEERGYEHWRHRQQLSEDTVLLLQSEQWSDRDFYKEFYYEEYKDRTEPRTFANLTATKPTYIVTASLRANTHGSFVHQTEQLPEATVHVLERRVAKDLYLTFDTINSYLERDAYNAESLRLANVARLTYDLDAGNAVGITPFVEVEGTLYSDKRDSDDPGFRQSNTIGTTLQTRFHRNFKGRFGFSGFKHAIVPSLTVSYRPETTLAPEDTPRFDAADNVYGRARVESKIDNVLFGRDAATRDVWQVARLTLYHGADVWNEKRNAEDYEFELDLRPRPWWGLNAVGEHHSIEEERDWDEAYYVERSIMRFYEGLSGRPLDLETAYQLDTRYGDYDRFLTYIYYDDTVKDGVLRGRLGFAYTETQERVFNRELLYGAGINLGEKWSIALEHRFDLEREELVRQEFELRRTLHCWDVLVRATDRESGWDLSVEFNISAFPGTKVKF